MNGAEPTRIWLPSPLRKPVRAVLHHFGWKHLAARRLRLASAFLRASLAVEPMNAETWLLYGHSLKERGLLAPAVAAYRMARRRGYSAAECDFQVGLTAILAGDREQALQVFRQLIGDRRFAAVIADRFLTDLLKHDSGVSPESVGFRPDPGNDGAGAVLYDITDLIDHAGRSAGATMTVTGIQRVQLELLTRTVAATGDERWSTGFVFFHPVVHRFVLIDPRRLMDLISNASVSAAARFESQVAIMEEGASCESLRDAILVNLGVAIHPAYFAGVSRMRDANGWKSVNLVHDCLPITNPDYFDDLTRERFRAFIRGAAACTDLFLTSTRATKARLIEALQAEGVSDPQVAVVPFGVNQAVEPAPGADEAALRRLGLEGARFVLFVSTLEIRKNHRLALDCWKALVARHGAEAMPQLLFVGRSGWFVDDLLGELRSLDPRTLPVRHLEGLGDDDLNALYRNCMFTLYPSLAEGWGLPVTESLSWSKPVLASSLDVIREAGGDLVDYADPQSVDSFREAAEKLIFDTDYRAARAARIAERHDTRTWSDVATDIDRVVRTGRS